MRRITPYEAQVWAHRQRFGGDVAAKIILMLLADYADEWATCFPGVDRIAEETELSRSTVLRKLKVLAACGLIGVEKRANERGHRTSNRYTLEVDVMVTAQEWADAKATVAAEDPRTTTVLGVNVTPGSPPPPKCHAEREAQVSSGDTGTTSRTPSSTPLPPTEPTETIVPGASAAAPALFEASGSSAPSAPVIDPEIAFTRFWAVYPRRVGRGAARRAWTGALKKATVDEIMAGVSAYAQRHALDRIETKYTPHPSSWLNGERWADEEQQATPMANPWETLSSPSEQRQAWQ